MCSLENLVFPVSEPCPLLSLSLFLSRLSVCLSVQSAAAAWKDPPADCVTGTAASACVTQERLGRAAMAAGQATGVSPTAVPASVMDTLTGATRGLGPVSGAGPTREGPSVKGGTGSHSRKDLTRASVEPALCP